ncbi:SdpA family antimicrobial peptide system protein [Microbispora sp. CA-135349]|uniref:SdpA family antimicrobial peptide system protein n=1 Tax=Microbispora sp. CA-135349 TaxID=3239953 RepID=UPI003D8A6C49
MTGRVPDTRLGLAALCIGAVWVLVIAYVVHSQLPAHALRLPGEQELRADIRQVAPQGWAFFTRSAREPRLEVWTATGAGAPRTFAASPPETRAAAGWDRGSRARMREMDLLAGSVPGDRWRACDGAVAICLSRADAVTVASPVARPTLCGTVGLSRRVPLPWAWAGSAQKVMPSTVTVVNVTC